MSITMSWCEACNAGSLEGDPEIAPCDSCGRNIHEHCLVDWDGETKWEEYDFPAIYCPFCTGKQRSSYDKGFEAGFQEACKALIQPEGDSHSVSEISVSEFSQLHKLTHEIAKALACTKSWLCFDALKPLPHETWEDVFPVEASKAISAYQGGLLSLSSLKETGEKQISYLSACESSLNLSGLTSLPGSSAHFLGKHKGDLTLGLEDLSEEEAKELSCKKGALILTGVKSVTPKVARFFEGFEGSLRIGLTQIQPEIASNLSKIKGEFLGLDRVEEVDTASAHELSSFNGHLYLGLKKIDKDIAAELGHAHGGLTISSLEALSKESASHLVKRSGSLELSGLTEISTDVARILAQNKGDVSLGGLGSISEDAALEFSRHKHSLYLYGLTDLSDKSAEHLSAHRTLSTDSVLFLSLALPRESLFELLSYHEGTLMLGIGARPFSFRREDSRTIEPKEAEFLLKHKGKVIVRWVDALKSSVVQILKTCPSIEGIDYDSIHILKETSKELKRRNA